MTDRIDVTRQGSLLVVDDNGANLRLLADMLTSRGYMIHTALDGATALKLVPEVHPDVILLDIAMPGMDGYEVCRVLKADALRREIPVIFISALTETDDIVKGFDVGGADYITKPFKFREVLARVQNQITLTRQRREIEELRQQDRQHFARLDAMKNEFIRMATHDLRNPLNVILGYLKLLEEVEVAAKDQTIMDDARRAIGESVEKMRLLVTDLLDLSQLETGLKLTFAPVALASALDKSLGGLRLLATQRGITLTVTPPPEDVRVQADAAYLARLIDNLVSNAIKYTPQGGQVDVHSRVEDERAVLEVQDSGLGIAPEDLPHLFEPFFRVNRGDLPDVEGSGLGLSIVKTIVEQHGGEIRVTSVKDQGSTFTVCLPLAAPLEESAAAASTAAPTAEPH